MDAHSVQQSYNESNGPSDRINSLIEERANLTEQLKACKEKEKRYTTKRYALNNCILVRRMELEQESSYQAILQKNVEEALEQSEINQRAHKELRDKNIHDRVEKCQKFSTIVLDRGSKFKDAPVEYSAANLIKYTQEFREASEVLDKKLSERQKQLDEDEQRYLQYMNKSMDEGQTKLNMVLQHIRSTNTELQKKIRCADNELQAIRHKSKMSKEALAAFKAKATALRYR